MQPGFDNAEIDASTRIEPNVEIGLRYHPECGPARIGGNGIVRSGTIIYGDVEIGAFFQSGHHAVIRAKVRMGDYCTVSNHCVLEGLIRFGTGVRVMSHVYIPSRSYFGDDVFVGPNTVLLNDRTPGRHAEPVTPRGPTIGNDVMIGGGVTVLPGISIGAGSFVAAGTVVTRNVPEKSFVIGPKGDISTLPPHLDRPNDRALIRQPTDLWHPEADLAALDWPEDWPERWRPE